MRQLKDPRVDPMTSVTKVEVAPDLKTCKAYISILGEPDSKEECRAALKSASGFIRHELAQQLNLRLTPEITFLMDDSIEYGVEMSYKIDEIMEEQNKAAALRDESQSNQ